MNRQHKTNVCLTLAFFMLLASCTPVIGPYSPIAYQYATSLKAETLAMMDKAKEPYNNHKKDIESLLVELHKAHEFVKGVPSNSISAQQWEILIRKDGDLVGKFFTRWKERGSMSEPLITEFKGPVSNVFDEIICLEANKKEPSDCK